MTTTTHVTCTLETLAVLGFDTVDADCEQARQRAYDSYPDVVVTDLTPRGDDGWQLIRDLNPTLGHKTSLSSCSRVMPSPRLATVPLERAVRPTS
jgi:hypothetical protein